MTKNQYIQFEEGATGYTCVQTIKEGAILSNEAAPKRRQCLEEKIAKSYYTLSAPISRHMWVSPRLIELAALSSRATSAGGASPFVSGSGPLLIQSFASLSIVSE